MPTITLEQRLLNARNAYAYPLVYIERLVLDGNGKYLPVAAPGPLQLLDDWEVLHSTRLRSTDPEQALLGVVSIAFWGFYAGSVGPRTTAARALARAAWAANGRPTAKAAHPGPVGVRDALQEGATHLAAGDIASAIRSVARLPEFGQLSFASKILTPLSFGECGVYDSVISEALAEGQWDHLAVQANQGGITRTKAAVYARWCRQASKRAAEMNSLGKEYGWDYHGIATRPWRAVDVERAFFQDKDVRLLGTQAQ